MYLSLNNNVNKKLSYIFDLNYNTIKNLSIPALCIFMVYLLFFIIVKIIEFKIFKTNCLCIFLNSNKRLLNILKTIFWFTKSLFYYFLWNQIERSDIGKYEDFLKCKFVNKNYFDENFPDIDKLRKYYIYLIIINLVADGFDKIDTVIQSTKEENEEDEPDEKSKKREIGERSSNIHDIKGKEITDTLDNIPIDN